MKIITLPSGKTLTYTNILYTSPVKQDNISNKYYFTIRRDDAKPFELDIYYDSLSWAMIDNDFIITKYTK